MNHQSNTGHWFVDILLNAFIWTIVGFYKLIASGICWSISLLFHRKLQMNLSDFNERLHTVAICLAILVSILTAIKLLRGKGSRKFSKKARRKD